MQKVIMLLCQSLSVMRDTKPWMSKDLKSLIRQKFSAWQSYAASRWSPEMKQKFSIINKKCGRSINAAIMNYETKLASLSKSNPKLRPQSSIIKALNSIDGLRTHPKEIMFSVDDFSELPLFDHKTEQICEPTTDELFNVTLDQNKAIGPDKI
ncbi:hypothetical protein BpHYR1_003493, partial [Brachionus plicatilis]